MMVAHTRLDEVPRINIRKIDEIISHLLRDWRCSENGIVCFSDIEIERDSRPAQIEIEFRQGKPHILKFSHPLLPSPQTAFIKKDTHGILWSCNYFICPVSNKRSFHLYFVYDWLFSRSALGEFKYSSQYATRRERRDNMNDRSMIAGQASKRVKNRKWKLTKNATTAIRLWAKIEKYHNSRWYYWLLSAWKPYGEMEDTTPDSRWELELVCEIPKDTIMSPY